MYVVQQALSMHIRKARHYFLVLYPMNLYWKKEELKENGALEDTSDSGKQQHDLVDLNCMTHT